MKKIIFGEPLIQDEEIQEVVKTLRSGWIGTGSKVQQFEKQFAAYVGSSYALAVNSCTAALHLSLLAAGVKPGDEVITTPLTFAATVNTIWHCGARPVFVDVDPGTYNIDPKKIEGAITAKTKAILPVHFGGLPADLNAIKKIARRHNLMVIEDAAHAVGAIYKGMRIGSHGNLTCFSFYANKNITTGEGGMIATTSGAHIPFITMMRLHGLNVDAWKRYRTKKLILARIIYPGFKYNMTDLQASLGIWQLKKLEKFLSIRERYAQHYDNEFLKMPYVSLQYRPPKKSSDRHALHLYTLVLQKRKLKKTRDEIVKLLRSKGVGAAIHYDVVHLHPFYKKSLNHRSGNFPIAETIGSNIISLPLTPKMTLSDVFYTMRVTKNILKAATKK